MNKKKTRLSRILPKLVLVVALVCVLTVLLSSCGSSNAISVKDITEWGASTEAATDASTETEKEETGTGVENGTETENGTEAPDKNDSLKNVTVSENKGFIDTLLSFIGRFLNIITRVMPARSYILTLLIFAIILEVLFLPFSIKQQKNSIKQAMLRPKEMAIRKKYAGRNDQATQQKVTQEIQELYQKENFNPLSGCLPLLIQLPILIILYSVVVDPIKHVMGYSADFSSFIYSYLGHIGSPVGATNGSVALLSKIVETPIEKFADIGKYCANPDEVMAAIQNIKNIAPNFSIGPVNTGLTPTFSPAEAVNWWLLAIPVLTFVVYFFTMKINKKIMAQPTVNEADRQAACSGKMMDYTMPLMSVWMTFIVPGAVGIYWMFKSIIGVIKQIILAKAMPLPTFTEADYKAAEKEMFSRQPKKIQKSENVGKVRSLHHIDDDDYDEKGNYIGTPTPKTSDRYDDEGTVEEKAPEQLPENSMTDGASLKDESDRKSKKSKKDKKDAE